MSDGSLLPWADAYALAEHAAEVLRPHVQRLKAVGSLRRRRPYVRDIEFLAEPRMVVDDLFGNMAPDVAPIRAALEQLGTWVKGAERMMQITDLGGRVGLKCELYLVHPPAQWGSLLAIRTGPYELGRHAVTRMRERGFRHDGGRVLRGSEVIPTPTEEDFFAAAWLPCLAPHLRDEFAQQLEAQSAERRFHAQQGGET